MLKLPLCEAGATIEVGCLKQIAIQRDRTLEFRFRFGIPLPQRQREASGSMRFGKTALEIQRFGACRKNTLKRHIHVVVQKKKGIAVGNTGIGARVERVEFDSLGEHSFCKTVICSGVPVEKLPSPEVVGVSFDIPRRRLFDSLLFFRQQPDLELVDDGVCDLVLDGEDVGQVAVITIGPKMAAVLAVDELPGDTHALAGFSHAAFQQELDPSSAAACCSFTALLL